MPEHEDAQSGLPPPPHPYRPVRSKEGCLTCRRRKVRCNETRPRCSHCERLNLECRWKPPGATQRRRYSSHRTPSTPAPNTSTGVSTVPLQRTATFNSPLSAASGSSPQSVLQAPQAVDQFFDYASFMWDNGDLWRSNLPPRYETIFMPGEIPHAVSQDTTSAEWPITTFPSAPVQDRGATLDTSLGPVGQLPAEDQLLVDTFVHSVVPPILSPVETRHRWAAMCRALISMSMSSTMVRHSILAFSEVLRRREGQPSYTGPDRYETASMELAKVGDISKLTSPSAHRENLLAALFFLSYVDILDGRIAAAHQKLKSAYNIFRQGTQNGFVPVEIRLLSWIRLLDARAVSAGGEGLFLANDDETLLGQLSPSSLKDENDSRAEEGMEDDIEDVLFQILYQPGIVFFQKVQSFMGRISKIDPWHRSRGTVEDETEVMNIAADISKDLRILYKDRPPLMDYAVAGKLTSDYLSSTLAFTITRAFRTYLANYHASKVHLHRVAYKSLPLPTETLEALKAIRHLAKLMVEGLEEQETLPVNMLWPLLMLGSEEEVAYEREWIKAQILRMERVATNARITAQVLEEVQARQDSNHVRVDIRSVMHDIFNSCFAIV